MATNPLRPGDGHETAVWEVPLWGRLGQPQASAQQRRISRRDFLRYAWWAAAGLVLAEGGIAIVASLWPQTKAGSFGSKIVAGSVDEFPVGSVTYVESGRFYVSRLESGILALYRKCTHLGCVVPWQDREPSEDDIAARGRFNCPCHSSIFDRHGLVRGGPAPRPLDIFPVTIEGGKVVVDTGTVRQRSTFDESQVTKV